MQKSKYYVTKDKDKYILEQNHKMPMDFDEVMKTKNKIDQDILNGEKQIRDLEKQIKEKTTEKNLENAKEQVQQVKLLKEKLELATKDDIEKLKSKIRADLKVMKAEKGYSRVSDNNQKIAMSSAMMADVAVKYDVDVSYSFMREIRKEFDKI